MATADDELRLEFFESRSAAAAGFRKTVYPNAARTVYLAPERLFGLEGLSDATVIGVDHGGTVTSFVACRLTDEANGVMTGLMEHDETAEYTVLLNGSLVHVGRVQSTSRLYALGLFLSQEDQCRIACALAARRP